MEEIQIDKENKQTKLHMLDEVDDNKKQLSEDSEEWYKKAELLYAIKNYPFLLHCYSQNYSNSIQELNEIIDKEISIVFDYIINHYKGFHSLSISQQNDFFTKINIRGTNEEELLKINELY